LKEIGFKINPYDSCISNNILDRKECMIAWYVVDIKISHVNPDVVIQVIEDIEMKFGKMSVS